MTTISLKADGTLSLTPASGDVAVITYDLHDYLGDGVDVQTALSLVVGASTPLPNNTILRLTWIDTATDDQIYQIEGVLGLDEDNTSSFQSRADASEAFSLLVIDISGTDSAFTTAVTASDAYNAPNTLARKFIALSLPSDEPPSFNADTVYDIITLMEPRPSYLTVPNASDLPLLNAMQRAMDKLNISLDIELDPTLTIDQVVDLATSIDAQDHRVSLTWNPTLSRPRDAVSLRGAKTTRSVVGERLGQMLLRNARTNAQGIPPIHIPVAGHDFPITFKGMQPRPDIVLNDEAIEKLAVAKVNTVRRIRFDTGVRFVLADILTQYQSSNSALRLKTSVDIVCYTTNGCIDILKRHMLKAMASYLTDADRDIKKFLDACYTAGLLKPADDLNGKSYSFTLTPDEEMPFERVRLYLARRPEGATRSAIFDDVVSK